MNLLLKLLRRKIKLPTTPQQFDDLVQLVCNTFGLTDRRHAAAVISVAIRHLPNDEYQTTLDYLGGSVIKALANHVANWKSKSIEHEVQVQQLVDRYKENPLDAQVRDELVKAAQQGSEPAQKACKELNLIPPDLKVVPTPEDLNEKESLRDPGISQT